MKSISMQAAAFAKESAEAEITAAIKAAMAKYQAQTGLCITDVDVRVIMHTTYGETDLSVLAGVRVTTSAESRL